MALVERDISQKPITEESTLDALNREVVPVARTTRAAVNRYLQAYSETVGDGVETVFTITHNLGSEDIFAQVRTLSTGILESSAFYAVTVIDENTVEVFAPAAPAVDDMRVSIRV